MAGLGTLRADIYVTDPHHLTVGHLEIPLSLLIEGGQIQVVVDGSTVITEVRAAIRKAADGATMYVDALGGRQEVGTITKE